MQLTYDVVCIGIGLRAELRAVETCLASMQIYDNSGWGKGWGVVPRHQAPSTNYQEPRTKS